jgi:hypothetical protein
MPIQKRVRKLLPVFVAGLMWFSLSCLSAHAQVLTGSVVGNVTDASGAVVAGADVTLRNVDTNDTRHTTASGSGAYSFESVPPGTYEVRVAKNGFSQQVLSGVIVSVNTVARANAALTVGAVTQTVSVDATAAQLQTDSADVHAQLTTIPLSNLPVQPGRDFQALFVMEPGFTMPSTNTSTPGNPDRSLEFTANGANEEGNVTRIDGAINSNIWRPYAIAYVPALDAIETVSAVTASFTAENGTAGGAVINVTIKSGTNALHGSAFEYYNGSATEAKPYFLPAGQNKGLLVENQFGGTVGGPIMKDKLFYFVSVQGHTNHQVQEGGLVSVPTAAEKAGNFTASTTTIYDPMTGNQTTGAGRTQISCGGVPNTICPNRIPSQIAKILPLWPNPTLPGDQNNLYVTGPYYEDLTTLDAKINWTPTSKLNTFIRFGGMDWVSYNSQVFGDALGGPPMPPVGGQSGYSHGSTLSLTASATYVKSPTLVFDTYYGYTRAKADSRQANLNQNIGLDVLGIPGTNGPYWFQGGWPQITIANFTAIGAPSNFQPNLLNDPEYEWVFDVGKTKGAHSMRFGIDIIRGDLNELQIQPLSGAGAQGAIGFAVGQTSTTGATSSESNSFASFMLGETSTLGTSAVAPAIANAGGFTNRSWEFAAYGQDQWQVNKKLTLSYGLRWQYFPMVTRADRGIEFYDIASNNMYICGYALVPTNCGISMSKKLFEPRVGIAYRLSDKFVVRSGFGISHDPFDLVRIFRVNYPIIITSALTAPNSLVPLSNISTGIPPITFPSYGNGIIPMPGQYAASTILPHDWKRGYTMSWNLTLERELGKGWSAQAGYVGTREVSQLSIVNENPGTVGGGNASEPLNILFGRTATTQAEEPVGTYKYDGLQASLKHRFTAGFETQVGYTFSKDLGICGSTDNDGTPCVAAPGYYNLNRARTTYDHTHNLEISAVADLPFGAGKMFAHGRVASAILGGWRMNALWSYITGAPFNVTAPATSLNAPGSTQRANLVGPIQKLGGKGPGNPYYSPSSFAQVTTVSFGNFPFYKLTGPPLHPFNAGIARNFKILERFTLQFRADAFNVTNSPDFAAPNGTVGSSSFMTITSVANTGREGIDQRMWRFGARLSF